MKREDRAGMALPVVLVLILALTVLGYGSLALATTERRTARAAAEVMEARLVAEGAARLLEDRLGDDSLPRIPLWHERTLLEGRAGTTDFAAALQPLGAEWHLVLGWSRRGPDGPARRVARTLWSMDPVTRVAAFASVVEHGGPLRMGVGAGVGGSGLLDEDPAGVTGACAPYVEALDTLLPRRRLPAAIRDTGIGGDAGALPPLGLLGAEDLRARLADRVSGTVTPAPAERDGECDASAPHNWGAPSKPDSPCGQRRIAVMAEGDLRLTGGEGQGLLVVDGTLHVDGTLFSGVVIVRDTLVVASGGRVEGLVRVGGPVYLDTGARVEGQACSAALALAGQAALRHPLAPGERPWVRPYGPAGPRP